MSSNAKDTLTDIYTLRIDIYDALKKFQDSQNIKVSDEDWMILVKHADILAEVLVQAAASAADISRYSRY
jgi:hypothetical protein